MSQLVLHPEIIRQRRQIDELRRELADLFNRRIELSFHELPALRHRYTELFGELEMKLQERTLELSQRKRMVELFALKIDRGEKIDATMVELVMKAVAKQFSQIRGRVERQVAQDRRRVDHGTASMQTQPVDDEGLTPRQRQGECHRIFRRLAWRLHPDSLGENDVLCRDYWDVAQEAYKQGDVALLRTLNQLVIDMGSGYGIGLDGLKTQREKLMSALRAEERGIERITTAEPYTLRDHLEDETWVESRRTEMTAELDAIEAEITACNDFLDPILAMAKDASPPEVAADVWSNFVETFYINSR